MSRRGNVCGRCGETLSIQRFDDSCDRCCHYRQPLTQVDWYDGPLYSCEGCLTDEERRRLFERAAGGAEFVQALHEQLDNDIRIDIGEMRLADRGLYEEEREAIVQSVLRVLSAPPSPAGIEANQGDEK